MIHLAIISSEQYAEYAATTLLSVLKNMDKNRACHIYVLTEDISNKSQKKIEKLKKVHDFEITYLFLKDSDFAVLSGIKCPYYISRIAASRVLLPSLLPNLDKIVCIESDMIFRHDICELYDTNIGKNYIAAVEDFARKIHAKDLWNNIQDIYFNTGVMLVNLKKLRQINYIDLIKEHIQKNGYKYKLQEQCLLNDAYKGKIYRLNIKWNFYHEYYSDDLKRRIQFVPESETEYQDALTDPWVIHTPGADKFWQPHFNHPYKKEYMHLYKSTPFYRFFRFMNYTIHSEKYKYITFYDIPFFSEKYNKDYKKINLFGLPVINYIKTASVYCKKFFGICLFKKYIDVNIEKRYFLGVKYYQKTKDYIDVCSLRIIRKQGKYKVKLFGFKIIEKIDSSDRQYICIFGIPVYFHDFYKKRLLESIEALRIEQKSLKERLLQMSEYQYQIMWLPQKVAALHSQVFPQFRNIHEGEDVVVVGCGPTLYDYTPIVNAKHISLNRAFRYEKIKFDYAFIWDVLGMIKANDGCVEDFLNYDTIKFIGMYLDDKVPYSAYITNKKGALYRCYSSARYCIPFTSCPQGIDLPLDTNLHLDISLYPLADFASISFAALHFASWTHPKRIYLVGLDTAVNGSFDGRQNPYHFKEMFLGYRIFNDFMKKHYPETEIISINPIGLKGIFKDVYTPSFLEKHPEIKNVETLNVKE